MNLILVEDDESAALGVVWALNAVGHQVTPVHRGRPVFGLIAAVHPDAIILDLTLPDLDGVTVAKLIRNYYLQIPIVFTTGHGPGHAGVSETASVQHAALLQKPYEISELIHIIEHLRAAVAEHC